MRPLARLAFGAALASLAGCGESGSLDNPPREVRFLIDTLSGNPYQIVELQSSNGPTQRVGSGATAGPLLISMLNAEPPVRGVFAASAAATASTTISLVVLGQITKIGTLVPGVDETLALSTAADPAIQIPGNPSAPNVRFEVIPDDPTQRPTFTATLGDRSATYLACGDSAVCQTPAVFFLEGSSGPISAAFSKLTNDDQSYTATLYFNGQAVASATATQSHLNAVVTYNP